MRQVSASVAIPLGSFWPSSVAEATQPASAKCNAQPHLRTPIPKPMIKKGNRHPRMCYPCFESEVLPMF